MSVEADPTVVRLNTSETSNNSKEGLKRLNFLKRYKALKIRKHGTNKTKPGESEKNPIVIEEKPEKDNAVPVSNNSLAKWYQSFMADNAEEKSDEAGNQEKKDVFQNRYKDQYIQSDGDEIGTEEDDTEQYYTFTANVAKPKPKVTYESADQKLFERPRTNKFVQFFLTPAEKMKIADGLKKMVGVKDSGKHMDLDLFDTDIQSMPMVNSFSRSNGQWGLNENEEGEEDTIYYKGSMSKDGVNDTNMGHFSKATIDENQQPIRHVQRRSERVMKPNGEMREVVQEEFIERTEKRRRNRAFAEEPSSFGSDLAELYKNKRIPAPHNSLFKRRMKDFQYYTNGVDIPGYKRSSMLNNGHSSDSSSFINRALPSIPPPRARASRRGSTQLASHPKSRGVRGSNQRMAFGSEPTHVNADLGMLKGKIIGMLHTNYDANILEFHANVRKLLSMIPIISYIEPFLAVLEVAIPKSNNTEFTNPAALLIAVIDGIISLLAMYWGIKLYIVIARLFKSVLWVLVKIGII